MQREPMTRELLAEALPLLQAHWSEVAHFQDIPLDVDEEAYLNADALGMLRCYTVRRETDVRRGPLPSTALLQEGIYDQRATWSIEQRLVGYALYFVRPNLHYKTSVQASQDVIYLDPSVRGGTGYRFITWCDDQLRAEGVVAAYQHSKAAHDFGKLLQRQGYELVDLIYAKRLDR